MPALASPPPLSPSLARYVFAQLCASLPPPSDDTPETRHARDELAKDAVAALCPADAFEADLAVRIVSTGTQALDSLRQASLAQANGDDAKRSRCLAQAASMARQSDSAYRVLQRRQATRDKQRADMHPAAMERAGYWFHEAAPPEPDPAPPPDPTPAPAPEASFESLSEADQYALMYPDRARRIRAAGGLPPNFNAGPPAPDLLQQIVAGTSPTLCALDPPALMAAA